MRARNLRFVIACRELPLGLDLAGVVLEGPAVTLTSDSLRFSQPEVARYFDLCLSRRELTKVTEESGGWPIALCIRRNEGASGLFDEPGSADGFAENWVGSRLLYGLSDDERNLVLDTGLLDWFDESLLDEVLGSQQSKRRIDAISALAGMLRPTSREESAVWTLHPLIRDYCAKHRFRETPDRYRWVHRRLALALERRGETVSAMRHAAAARLPDLVGEILENAGGLRIWLEHGLPRLQAADRYVSEEVLERCPRAGLAHCTALALSGRLREARQAFADVEGRFRSEEDPRFHVDASLARGLMAMVGCESLGSTQLMEVVSHGAAMVDAPGVEPLVRATYEYGRVVGSVDTGGQTYRIRSAGGGLSSIVEVEEPPFRCGVDDRAPETDHGH